jgi:Raf kinase inhibitor-like YbhB/YbcL family protein
MPLELKTTAFAYGGEIPAKYTCSGADLSPALNWNGVSRAARSLALIANDPDAPRGTWTHWLIWNIPTHLTELPEGVPKQERLEIGARQGRNDFNSHRLWRPMPTSRQSASILLQTVCSRHCAGPEGRSQ